MDGPFRSVTPTGAGHPRRCGVDALHLGRRTRKIGPHRTPRIAPAPIHRVSLGFLGLGMMLGAWSFATPMAAAPDEPSHVVQATAILQGQFDEPEHPTAFRASGHRVRSRLGQEHDCALLREEQNDRANAWGSQSRAPYLETLGESGRIVPATTPIERATSLLRCGGDPLAVPRRRFRRVRHAPRRRSGQRRSRRFGDLAPAPLLPTPHRASRGPDRPVTNGALSDGSGELQWPGDCVGIRDVVRRTLRRCEPRGSPAPRDMDGRCSSLARTQPTDKPA